MAKRRANGEGNIRKRKDGRWEGRYSAGYDPNTGKRIIKNVLGKTQAEVKEKLKAALQEAETLDLTRADGCTVKEWVNTWFETYSKPNIRPSTANYYRRFIDRHIIPVLGDIKLKNLTARHIQNLYTESTGQRLMTVRCFLVLSAHFAVWVRVWVMAVKAGLGTSIISVSVAQ